MSGWIIVSLLPTDPKIQRLPDSKTVQWIRFPTRGHLNIRNKTRTKRKKTTYVKWRVSQLCHWCKWPHEPMVSQWVGSLKKDELRDFWFLLQCFPTIHTGSSGVRQTDRQGTGGRHGPHVSFGEDVSQRSERPGVQGAERQADAEGRDRQEPTNSTAALYQLPTDTAQQGKTWYPCFPIADWCYMLHFHKISPTAGHKGREPLMITLKSHIMRHVSNHKTMQTDI